MKYKPGMIADFIETKKIWSMLAIALSLAATVYVLIHDASAATTADRLGNEYLVFTTAFFAGAVGFFMKQRGK